MLILRFSRVMLSGLLILLSGCGAPGSNPTPEAKPVQEIRSLSAATGTITPGWKGTCDVTPSEAASILSGSASASGAETARTLATVRRAGNQFYVVHVEFKDADSCGAFEVPGVTVFHRFQKWADLFAPGDDATLNAIDRAPGYVWKEFGADITEPPPPPGLPAASRGASETIVRGGASGMTGKGVIVAIVDSGIDFRHPDFIKPDDTGKPTSRLLYLWDTTSDDFETRSVGGKAPFTYPGGASIGTLYSRDQLSAQLRSKTAEIGLKDSNGHGTACAGIAAGNGSVDARNCGVAPDADIIGVRIGGTGGRGLENVWLLGAICAWIDTVAGTTPCVVSCSLGGHGTQGHDGSGVVERQLDARFAAGVKGRALCIAAGNEATHGLHGETTFSSTKGTLRWRTAPQRKARVGVYFKCPGDEDINCTVTGPEGNKATLTFKFHPITNQWYLVVGSPPGEYTLDITCKSGNRIQADAYICAADSYPRFVGPCATASKQIGTPGTTGQAITVGSYDFNSLLRIGDAGVAHGQSGSDKELTIGAISSYSNPGPRRNDDAIKPEIVAPGQYHITCFPLEKCGLDEQCKRDPTGKYCADFNGTSAATPYCAGVIALMLQKNPRLTVGEIRKLLRDSARGDDYTGDRPNSTWGYGKLNRESVLAVIAAIKAP